MKTDGSLRAAFASLGVILLFLPIFAIAQKNELFEVRLIDSNILYASASHSWMTMKVASPFCNAINTMAEKTGAKSLVVNLSSMTKATPRAGLYGFRQMKHFKIEHIAFYGGGGFIRGFAKTVLTLAGFRSFKFLKTEQDAIAWAEIAARK